MGWGYKNNNKDRKTEYSLLSNSSIVDPDGYTFSAKKHRGQVHS